MILQHYSVKQLKDLQIDRKRIQKIEDIQCVNTLCRALSKLNIYIQCFNKTRAVATLHELHEGVKSFCCEGEDFDTLKLGPFLKQPMVYDFFQAPSDLDPIPAITTDDIIDYLKGK